MENEKKADKKEEISIKQSLDVTKGPTIYGENSLSLLKPKRYECPICGEILAADVLWKDMEDGEQKPFCGECKKPVILISKRDDL
jgi:ribosomal protein S27AE